MRSQDNGKLSFCCKVVPAGRILFAIVVCMIYCCCCMRDIAVVACMILLLLHA